MKTNIISEELVRIMFDIKDSGEITVNLDEKNELSVHVLGWGTLTKNVYQLASECKEWAFGRGYEILEGAETLRVCRNKIEIYSITNMCQRENFKPFDNHYTFKACKWILEEEDIKMSEQKDII